ncbi:MAG: hypothetical protein JNL87_19375 [Burkholderiaceae bacterium]|nr:hypothetical protein [Burkholderiaceae bacterium]
MAEPAIAARAVPLPARAWAGQVLLYALFAAVIGVFSRWPVYHHLAADQALIKVSFTHTGKPVAECRKLSDAELARLPPNMRAPVSCPRERSPVTVEVDIGGAPALRRSAPPSGLSRDGASALYQRLVVPAGEHRIAVRLNDDARQAGFTYRRELSVRLAPAQVLVIDFDAAGGGITFK